MELDINNIISSFFGDTDNIWEYVKKFASTGTKELTRTVLQMFFCLKSEETSLVDKAIIVAGLGYQLLPSDLLPRDKYGVLGFLDNGVTLGLAISRTKANITPEISNQVEAILGQWFGSDESAAGPSRFIGGEESTSLPKEPTFPEVVPSHPDSAPKSDPFDDLIVD